MVDKKALKTLLNVFSFNGANGFAPGKSKEFLYAKSAGLMFDNIRMSHDNGISWLLEVRPFVQKEKVTDLFLASLSSRRLEWRSGLSAYAIARNFPDHKLENKDDWGNYCKICGDHSYEINQERELNLYNYKRFITGGYESMHSSPDALAFYLHQITRQEHIIPTKTDLTIWRDIVQLLCFSQNFKSANDLERGLSSIKTFKSNKIERRAFLETLSLAGVIATREHKGYFPDFIPQIHRERRPNGASPNGWCYPILWWKGSEGINREALEFWFGNY